MSAANKLRNSAHSYRQARRLDADENYWSRPVARASSPLRLELDLKDDSDRETVSARNNDSDAAPAIIARGAHLHLPTEI
jgi:hypothetical protein